MNLSLSKIVLFLLISTVTFGQLKVSELPAADTVGTGTTWLIVQTDTTKKVSYDTVKIFLMDRFTYDADTNNVVDSSEAAVFADSSTYADTSFTLNGFTDTSFVHIGGDTTYGEHFFRATDNDLIGNWYEDSDYLIWKLKQTHGVGLGVQNYSGTDLWYVNSSGNIYVAGNFDLTGTLSNGTWEGVSIADAYIDNDITLTNLTQVTNRLITTLNSNAWKVFYSNGSAIAELSLGSSGTYLKANGASSAPTFSQILHSELGGVTANQHHNAVTIGTANGLSLSTQALSLALSSTSTTGALSDTDWDTFNNKEGALTKYDLLGTANQVTVTGSGKVLTAEMTLSTPQNIHSAATPTFGGFTAINGTSNLSHAYPLASDTYDLGSSTLLWRKGWLSEMQAILFAENTITLLGGWFYVTKDAGTVAEDVDNSETQIDFGKSMTLTDFVLFRRSGVVEYMQVGSVVGGTNYNVTRDRDGSGANTWAEGSPFAVLGQDGDGRIELNAYDTPRISLIKQGVTYNAQTEYIRIGDLNGFLGYGSETWGMAIGEATKYLKYDPSNGLRIAGNITSTSGTIGGWTLAANSLSATNIWLENSAKYIAINSTTYGNDGIQLQYNAGNPRAYIGDGSNAYLNFDGTKLTWKGANSELDASGNLIVAGGSIAGWDISGDSLVSNGDGFIRTSTTGTRIELGTSLQFYDSGDLIAAFSPTLEGSYFSTQYSSPLSSGIYISGTRKGQWLYDADDDIMTWELKHTPSGTTDAFFKISMDGGSGGYSAKLWWSDVAISPTYDVNLYRSAANTLKTDDDFDVGGTLNAADFEQAIYEKTEITTGATPSAADKSYLELNYGSNTAVTNFTGGVEGQRLVLVKIGGAFPTITDGASLALVGSADFVMGTNDAMELIYTGSLWVELSRSNN